MAPKSLTIGKYRGLQRCSTLQGHFTILALDHQDALRRILRPEAPASLTPEELTGFKMQVIKALSKDVSGVLLDPILGASQAIAQGILNRAGLLVELEKADYAMEPLPLDVQIDPAWNVAKIKRMGAEGVKLFFYYKATNEEHARHQDEVVRQVAADCARYDVPFFAEPIFYPIANDEGKQAAVVDAAQRTAANGCDVLKLEFPLDVQQDTDEARWSHACAAITAQVDVPWVLLSAGVSFKVFARQFEIASKAGASGFIAGRAVWHEAAEIADEEKRTEWLATEGCRRLHVLNAIAVDHARPWPDWYEVPVITADWYKQYPSFDG